MITTLEQLDACLGRMPPALSLKVLKRVMDASLRRDYKNRLY